MRRTYREKLNSLARVLLPLLLLVLAAATASDGVTAALALEQPVCCGMEEHIHTEECYFDHILTCGKRAHIHSGDCYLVLLEENNINWLIAEVGRDEGKSLTGVIESTVAKGLALLSEETEDGAADEAVALTALDSDRIKALNTALKAEGVLTAVVLNEGLNTAALAREEPTAGSSAMPMGGEWGDVGATEPTLPAAAEPVALRGEARAASLTLTYDLNWSSVSRKLSNYSYYGASYTQPTVEGGTSDTLTSGATATIRSPSATEVTVDFPLSSNSSIRPGVACFRGWQTSSGVLLSPDSVYTYDQLAGYADRSGTVALTAQWDWVEKASAVNFFVKYDSTTGGSTNPGRYTPVLFVCEFKNPGDYKLPFNNTNFGNVGDRNGDGTTDEYDIDIAIREAAEKGDLSSFPTDEYVFRLLKNYTSDKGNNTYLTVDGKAVDPNDLDEHGYTILWDNLAYTSDENYHIDGILVRKIGSIRVTKTFSGNAAAIEAVKQGGYTIIAESEKGKTLTLEMTPYTATSAPYGYTEHDAATDTYVWEIPDVVYGEKWTLHEDGYTCVIDGSTVTPYMEYTIRDPLGGQGAHEANKSSVTVTGQTYDQTISADQKLTVSFTNTYPGTDSLTLRKVDSSTGQALTGAAFTLSQNGTPLHFSGSDGEYTVDPSGALTELSSANGMLTIRELDFTQGSITVSETTIPAGYTPAGAVTLARDKNGDTVLSGTPPSGVTMANGILTIGNTPETETVRVAKQWSNASDARTVRVSLLANGSSPTSSFTNLTGSFAVELSADNSYTYTWTGLPAYANGRPVSYTVKEDRIGDERANADGSFDNWLVTYADATVTGGTGEKILTLTVTNTKKAGNALTVRKTDTTRMPLSGATFRLELLDERGQVSSDFTAEDTTGTDGLLTFNGLPFGSYQMTETKPPTGYEGAGTIRFTVNADKTITLTSGEGASVDGLTITVVNRSAQPLPSTGGAGAERYVRGGLALMLAAGTLLLRRTTQRREEDVSS